jgi:SNF2 family DNA or RNA helicase
MVLQNYEILNEVGWDYIILDEAHKIRNHTTKLSKAVQKVEAPHKILLTGTPIMNNLRV